MANNPYNQQKQEALYHSWDAGFNSQSEHECPYEEDDTEARDLHHAWTRGFKSNKARTQPKPAAAIANIVNTPESVPPQNTTVGGNQLKTTPTLTEIPTEVLLKEVSRRMSEFEEATKKFKRIFG